MKLKQIIAALIIISSLSTAFIATSSSTALECGALPQAFCASAETGDLETSATWKIIILVLRIMTSGIGVVAVAMIGYFGFLYATAGDNANQTKEAKEKIRNTVIGIILYGVMYIALEFLIPGGVFT